MDATTAPPPRTVRFGWIGEAWQIFSAQAGVWVLSALIYGAITGIITYAVEIAFMFRFIAASISLSGSPSTTPPAVMMRSMMPTMWVFGIVVALVFVALNGFFWSGMLKMSNKQVRGFPISVGDLFSGRDTFLRLLGYQLIFYLPLLLLGSITTYPMVVRAYSTPIGYDPFAQIRAMLPIYGVGLALDIIPIVLFALFWPAAALIADGEQVWRAIAKSWDAMKGSWLMASLLMLVVMILLMVTAMCFFALLVTIPMFIILSSLMYRDMIGMPQREPPPIAEYRYQQTPAPGVWPPPPSQNQDSRPSGGQDDRRS